MSHIRSLAGLTIAHALCVQTASASSANLARVGLLLGEIQLLAAGTVVEGYQTMPITADAQVAVDLALASLASCEGVARLFLHTHDTLNPHGSGITTWLIGGLDCARSFTFASGTTQLAVVEAINRFTDCTGVVAAQQLVSGVSTGFVRLDSLAIGADAFLSVVQTHDPIPHIYPTPQSPPVFKASDHGGVFADLDCDLAVGLRDLQLLLAAWGPVSWTSIPADLNGDGVVSGIDLGMLLGAWQTSQD